MVDRAPWPTGRSTDLDLLFIENVGNLVCPSSYDLGEALRLVLLSVTEGEDKPLKYPTIFNTADVAVVTKVDLAEAAGCDLAALRREHRPGPSRHADFRGVLEERRRDGRLAAASSAARAQAKTASMHFLDKLDRRTRRRRADARSHRRAAAWRAPRDRSGPSHGRLDADPVRRSPGRTSCRRARPLLGAGARDDALPFRVADRPVRRTPAAQLSVARQNSSSAS